MQSSYIDGLMLMMMMMMTMMIVRMMMVMIGNAMQYSNIAPDHNQYLVARRGRGAG